MQRKLIYAALFLLLISPAAPIGATQFNRALFKHVEAGSLSGVIAALRRGADLDARNGSRQTPLLLAATRGYLPIIKHLIKEGAALDVKDGTGRSLLDVAKIYSDPFLLRYFIKIGVAPPTKDWARKSLLRILTQKYDEGVKQTTLEIALILATLVKDLNAPLADGKTFLSHALKTYTDEFALILILAGASPVQADSAGNTPLDISLKSSYGIGAVNLLRMSNALPVTRTGSKNPREPLLIQAARSQNRKLLLYLLKKGANPKTRNAKGQNLPVILCQNRGMGVIKSLQEIGYYKNAGNYLEKHPDLRLAYAAYRGNIREAAIAIKEGAKLERTFKSQYGFKFLTPLFIAAIEGHWQAVRFLLKAGAKPNHFSPNYGSPLRLAIKENQVETVGLLIKAGAAFVSRKDRTPLLEMALRRRNQAIAAMIRKENVRLDWSPDKNKRLQKAVEVGDLKKAREAIAAGADPMKRQKWDNTLLMSAAKYGHIDLIAFLLKKAPKLLNLRYRFGETALYWAAQGGHTRAVALLLKAGAKTGLARQTGRTPLAIAAAAGHMGPVRLLLKAGAPISEINANENIQQRDNALSEAIRRDKMPMARFLIAKGATSKARDGYRRNLFLSSSRIRPYQSPLTIIKFLTKAGVPLNSRDKWGWTVMHTLAYYGHDKSAAYLLKQGANPNVQGLNGRTPLHTAILAGNTSFAITLVQAGARIETRDSLGMTPLLYALVFGERELFELLIRKKARRNVKNKSGRGVRDFAKQFNRSFGL